MQAISEIGDWYMNSTYFRIPRATKALHLLPKHVPYRLAIRDIAYQTFLHGFNSSLSKEKNKLCPSLRLYIGVYGLTSSNYARR
jgi:hypothetical protein